LVVGAGFSGAVVARQLAELLGARIEIREERNHIAGNCHTERDPATGVMVHRFGPHIFNTDNQEVWDYVHRFGTFGPFINRVKAHTPRGVFSMPINLHTINQFFGRTMNPDEARSFVASLGDASIGEPANFEEQALKMLGHELYDTFFKGYTIKQWGCDPKELPASILKRLPIRFNYDDNYYNKTYQGIPVDGYSGIVERILDHPLITVRLNTTFRPEEFSPSEFTRVIYTGPIDQFFEHQHGRLGYRTVTFERIETNAEDYQGNAVINYPDPSIPYTRIHEHKHFAPWETHTGTVAFREFSKETEPTDVPYYPKRLAPDKKRLGLYRNEAQRTEVQQRCPVSFLGRLATYRYMDMETVIGEALVFSRQLALALQTGQPIPVFPNEEAPL
jgi:UDP-galactopyranose mutase